MVVKLVRLARRELLKLDTEYRTSFVLSVAHLDSGTMALSNLFDDCKPEAATLNLVACNPEESFEDSFPIPDRNARAGIFYAENQTAAAVAQCHDGNSSRHSPAR